MPQRECWVFNSLPAGVPNALTLGPGGRGREEMVAELPTPRKPTISLSPGQPSGYKSMHISEVGRKTKGGATAPKFGEGTQLKSVKKRRRTLGCHSKSTWKRRADTRPNPKILEKSGNPFDGLLPPSQWAASSSILLPGTARANCGKKGQKFGGR